MAYPTGMLSLTLEKIDQRMVALRSECVRQRAELAAGNVVASLIVHTHARLLQERAAFAAAASVPGLAEYARDQKNLPGLDVVAEFNAVMGAIDGATGWITTNFPKDASGFLLREQFTATGTSDRTFTPAQTAGLRTQLDGIIAAIA